MGTADEFWSDVVPCVDPERCRRCTECPPVTACLAGAFRRPDPDALPAAYGGLCFGCYSCISACPYGAILLARE